VLLPVDYVLVAFVMREDLCSNFRFTELVSRASSALCWLRPGRNPYEKPRKSVS
jgi:hypothetical protein